MTTTTSQQAALEKANATLVYFAEFQFSTAPLYLSTFNQPLNWGGHDWIGLGHLASIGSVEESDGLEPKALNFTLSASDPSLLALAAGPVEQYRGRDAKLYMCPLNDQYQQIDTPILCWRGIMDMMSIGIDQDGAGQIILKCETSSYGLKRQPSLRMNHQQQKSRHEGDRGFEYLEKLIAEPAVWLSKKFQER
jgi:hypothetical protein